MKKFNFFIAFVLLVPTLLITSCKDEETVDANSFEKLKTYLLDQNMDLNDIIGEKKTPSFFVTAAPAEEDIATFLDKYHIIDIRSAEKYNAGHIEGAKSVPTPESGDLSGVLIEAANANKPILVVCYTGQTACFITSCLRLYGYSDTQALKWGMSGWNGDTDVWSDKTGNVAADDPTNWSYGDAPSNGLHDYPTIITNLTDEDAILKAQVEDVLKAGYKGVMPSEAYNDASSYHINNYFSQEHYSGFGHINGAYRIQPLLLKDETISNLDPDSKVVTYCYTGQTSAVITAYLRVLGYDAYSLMFGMNGLWNENPFWSDPEIKNQWGFDSKSKSLPLN